MQKDKRKKKKKKGGSVSLMERTIKDLEYPKNEQIEP